MEARALKRSELGAAMTSCGRVHHRRMVSGKKDHFIEFVLAAGIRKRKLFPLVDLVTGISWPLGMQISSFRILYSIVTLETALRC